MDFYKSKELNFYHYLYTTLIDDNESHWAFRKEPKALEMSKEEALEEAKNILDHTLDSDDANNYEELFEKYDIPEEYKAFLSVLNEMSEENLHTLEE